MIMKNRNRVPDTYFRRSRDFQLLCNIYDCIDMGVKFDIDSMLSLTDTSLCKENILPLLQDKLGFLTNINISGECLRTILRGFPYLLRNKGTRIGIIQCIHLFMNAINIQRESDIQVINNQSETTELNYNKINSIYLIKLNLKSNVLDIKLLDEMLKFIIPAGYGVEYHFYSENNFNIDIFGEDKVTIVFIDSSTSRAVTDPFKFIPDVNDSAIYNTDDISDNTTTEENYE